VFIAILFSYSIHIKSHPDSLLVLASSLFGGIGIEMDIDNVELGDIGGGVRSNNDGDSDGDGNGNCDGESDGNGNGDGDDIHHHQNQDVTSVIVSPRRTRLGKVVKYRDQ
jgi:hypothetical protein